jgi:hypothetical protein
MALDPSDVTSERYRAWARCALAGFIAFLSPQIVMIVRSSAPLADSPGWFLNSARNIAVIELTLAVGAAIAAFLRGGRWVEGAAIFTGGAIWAMVLTLFATGPGTIFPIVIGIGSALIVVAVALGTAAGFCGNLAVSLFRKTARQIG